MCTYIFEPDMGCLKGKITLSLLGHVKFTPMKMVNIYIRKIHKPIKPIQEINHEVQEMDNLDV